MKLSKLLEKINYKTDLSPDTEISGLTNNTERVTKDCVFVCIVGAKFDGHDFAQKALENGAAAVVVSRDTGVKNQIIVDNTSEAFAALCANFLITPQKSLL